MELPVFSCTAICSLSLCQDRLGMLEVEVFEWPQFDAANRAVFEEFAQQSNNAQGYQFNEVTLRGHCDSSDAPEAAVGPDSARAVAEQKELEDGESTAGRMGGNMSIWRLPLKIACLKTGTFLTKHWSLLGGFGAHGRRIHVTAP